MKMAAMRPVTEAMRFARKNKDEAPRKKATMNGLLALEFHQGWSYFENLKTSRPPFLDGPADTIDGCDQFCSSPGGC